MRIFYPTVYRANSAAWAASIAKIGSVSGLLVGGWVLATALPERQIFALLAICPAAVAVCLLLMAECGPTGFCKSLK